MKRLYSFSGLSPLDVDFRNKPEYLREISPLYLLFAAIRHIKSTIRKESVAFGSVQFLDRKV